MSKNLLEQFPRIIEDGRREVERILETRHLLALETREWVLPAKDGAILDWIKTDKRHRRVNGGADVEPNRLIHGKDLLVMAALLADDKAAPASQGKLDLVYMDTRLYSGKELQARIALQGTQRETSPKAAGALPHSEIAVRDIMSYLGMLVPRLLLAWELLSDRGSVCLRVGPQAKRHVSTLICDIFGSRNFTEHSIPAYAIEGLSDESGEFNKLRDTVLIFGKRTPDQIRCEAFPGSYEKDAGSDDRQYNEAGLPGSVNVGGHLPMEVAPESTSQKSAIAVQEALSKKLPGTASAGCNCLCANGAAVQDDRDGGYVIPESALLLETIILASTQLDFIVADFSGGFGDTAVIAERLGRRWITSDNGGSACAVMRKRLIDQNAKPFLYQAIAMSREDAAQALSHHALHAGDLAQIVLLLYGAEPLYSADASSRNLGQMLQAASKTLVLVEAPNTLTGLTSLKSALAQCAGLTDGCDRLVVLGWKFEPSIAASIRTLDDSRLEVRAIPSDLMDILKSNGNMGKLKDQVRFANVLV